MTGTLKKEIHMDDVILFFMCRLAEGGQEERIVLPTSKIHRSLADLGPMLERLEVFARFHRDPVETHSQQVNEAVVHLVPFALESSWKYGEGTRLELAKTAVPPRMENLKQNLSPSVIDLLEANLQKFQAGLG